MTLMVSFYVAKGTVEFLDLAMNFAALAIIAQLDDYMLDAVKNNLLGVEFADTVRKSTSEGIRIQLKDEVCTRHKRGVARFVVFAWAIIIFNSLRLSNQACGQPLVTLFERASFKAEALGQNVQKIRTL